MIVAISGSTGFIGSRLVARHLELEDTVRILTRRPVKTLKLPESCQIFHADLTDSIEKLVPFVEGVDVLYHCAGEINNPSQMHAVHVGGTSNLLQAAAGKIGRWVQLSSVGVYGPQRAGVVTEETSLNPQGLYETTKSESDHLVIEASQKELIRFSMLRPSNVFGPEMRNQSLRQMIRMIQKGLFFFVGSAGASANYIYVNNVIEALLLCGRQKSAEGQVYNLSDYQPLESFVGHIAQILGRRPPRLRLPSRLLKPITQLAHFIPGFPLTPARINHLTTRVRYSIERIQKDLGYRHPVTMEEGLQRLIKERSGVLS